VVKDHNLCHSVLSRIFQCIFTLWQRGRESLYKAQALIYLSFPDLIGLRLIEGIQYFQYVLDCPVKPDNDKIRVKVGIYGEFTIDKENNFYGSG
jgi:hypothetical protein